ncbi:hypothetical protein SKDZ_11G2280 [Saccharomyces kudriavzevii ZP591]|nr:hypothetical protein SKDZ_11G2280 [Saccharomyces kudriavzevii ZP591]
MMIKKRNKIRLPSNHPEELEEDISAQRSIQQIKPAVPSSLEDDDSDICALQPIKLKKVPKRKITFDGEQAVKENDSQYKGLYRSKENMDTSKANKDDEVILNMEDMMEEGHNLLSYLPDSGSSLEGVHSISVPTREEIVKIKTEKSIYRRNLDKGDVIREKDYVKLLNNEDKREIMETIKSNGGLKHGTEKEVMNFSDDEMRDFQDERLALTDSQISIQKDFKRKIIEEAISDAPYRVNEEWETQLLSKGNMLKPNEETITPLPILFPGVNENRSDIEEISEMVSKIRLQGRKVEMRLQALERARMDLENSKANLINTLIDG